MNLGRQQSGSVVCPSCGKLVGVKESECWNCGRTNPGMWGFGPVLQRLGADLGVTQIVVAGSIALFVLSIALVPGGVSWSPDLSFLSPSAEGLVRLGAAGAVPVFEIGSWWSILTAGWLHGSLIHILFNMMWVRQLAPATSMVFGPGRAMLIYLLASAGGFALSSTMGYVLTVLQGNPIAGLLSVVMGRALLTVGASAAIFGLLGAVVYAGRRGVAAQLGRQAWVWAIFLFVFGLVFPRVDNWAHLGGFLSGYALARWFDPLQRERPDHVSAAVALLVLTLVAFVAVFFRGRELFL